MQRGEFVVGKDELKEDVVVADGDLFIRGQVTGSVFVVNGDCMVDHRGLVEGNITVLEGDVWISAGASVKGEISVFSGEAKIAPKAGVSSRVRAVEDVPSLTEERVSTISRYIIFPRHVPAGETSLNSLSRLNLERLRMRKRRESEPEKLRLYELGSASVEVGSRLPSKEVVFRGHDLRARVCVFRFSGAEAAGEFWSALRREYEEKVGRSVHNSLGEGAHWYFRHEGSSYVLWHRHGVIVAVMVRHDDDDPEADEWERVEEVRDEIIKQLFKYWGGRRQSGTARN
ncbi:MAG: polymer-forming cytoskeletal protein [bacterium]